LLGTDVFAYTSDPAPLIIHTPADTADSGNTARYGTNHKQIIITAP
jgi:hypothetical protein